MTLAHYLVAHAPDSSVHRVPAATTLATIDCPSLDAIHGQWLLYTEPSASRLVGVYRHGRMDRVAGTLRFTVPTTDTGEDFALLLIGTHVLVLRLRFSPAKCPLPLLHTYLRSYTALIAPPEVGDRSLSGKAEPVGRPSVQEELLYHLAPLAQQLLAAAPLVAHDIPKHRRGPGGTFGLDALATLSAWKHHSDWYALDNPSRPTSITIGLHTVRALRSLPRVHAGSNYFIGAALTAIRDLQALASHGSVASVIPLLLSAAADRLRVLDTPTPLDPPRAWECLKDPRLPPRSTVVASLLVELHSRLAAPHGQANDESGQGPFLMPPPEILFQTFALMKCLLALGLPQAHLNQALIDSRTANGCRLGTLIAWTDTSDHALRGWRDATIKPSGYEPDLVVQDTVSHKFLLLDAKFRRDSSGLLPASGIKDIQAYMHEFGMTAAAMLVPSADSTPGFEDVSGEGFFLRGIALTPSIAPADLQALRNTLMAVWTIPSPGAK